MMDYLMKKPLLAVVGLFMLLYILPLGARPIIIPDESRYAEIPREMIVSGNWVAPRLNGLRYFEKPALGYWLNAISMLLFGQNAFAARLPSALAVGFTALIVLCLVRRFETECSAAILAVAVFLTFPLVFGVGTFSVLDSLLSLFIAGMLAAFFGAYMAQKRRQKVLLLALCGVSCGLAFLTKGFIAFAVPLVVVVPFMLWERRLKELPSLLWLPALIAVAVCLPWGLMIASREPDFWRYFFWEEHIRRFMAHNAQHAAPFWYYVPVLAGGALPWIIFSPAVIPRLKQAYTKSTLTRFTICWFLFPFLFFSASSGKLGTYILPCFPALAMLISFGLPGYLKEGKRQVFTRAAQFMAWLMALATLALLISQLTNFPGIRAYGAAENWKWITAVGGLLLWVGLLLAALRTPDWRRKLTLYCAAPLLFMFSGHFLVPDRVKIKKAPGEFLRRQSSRIQPDSLLVSDKDIIRAVCWFYKRTDVYQLKKGGELKYGLSYPDAVQRLLDPEQFRALAIKYRGTGRLILVAKTRRFKSWRQQLPPPLFEDSNGEQGFVFVQY